jgi:trans-aconitate 2-methyltransferase
MDARKDAWSPTQYERFKAQRSEPFYDLVAMVRPVAGMRIVDLGCGTGELTAHLASLAPGATVLGIDSSEAMLREATARSTDRIAFELGDIATAGDFGRFDLVFSNAALHWVPDNERLLATIFKGLGPNAQIAVQVPTNEAHASHKVASALALENPYAELLGEFVRRSFVLSAERYSELLYENGFREQVCIEKIYGHELPSTGDVVEWVKGTLLTAYLSRLDAEAGAAFVEEYRRRLLDVLGVRSPYFYPFRRLLFWGKRN